MTTGGLTDSDLLKAAAVVSCEIAIIKTIVDVEEAAVVFFLPMSLCSGFIKMFFRAEHREPMTR